MDADALCVLSAGHPGDIHTDGERFNWSEFSFSESLYSVAELLYRSIDPGEEHPEVLVEADRRRSQEQDGAHHDD
ncbi:hypothetical protein [Amycolatopsis sp. DSM 110486]|uniref:hypothetical protein n=1 Tax=Amycolatopsis sp. DSM 110486 TaxID=2865832 RepID=UPI001C69442D|nr:hypothetical protein [Amycolatopsis sp. DSM 110486]QYN17538.1 hypothetical protein K1T34_32655 [Amycolatopsis sp. DSM 110486]